MRFRLQGNATDLVLDIGAAKEGDTLGVLDQSRVHVPARWARVRHYHEDTQVYWYCDRRSHSYRKRSSRRYNSRVMARKFGTCADEKGAWRSSEATIGAFTSNFKPSRNKPVHKQQESSNTGMRVDHVPHDDCRGAHVE